MFTQSTHTLPPSSTSRGLDDAETCGQTAKPSQGCDCSLLLRNSKILSPFQNPLECTISLFLTHLNPLSWLSSEVLVLYTSLGSTMTTAHRPTFDPARGKEAQRGPAYHQRLLPAHTLLKVRSVPLVLSSPIASDTFQATWSGRDRR